LTTPLLDRVDEQDDHIRRRLSTELIIWLSTVTPAARPRSVPVWFLWEDPQVVVFSAEGSQKLRSIAANPQVWLALDSADHGNDVVLLEGTAAALEPGTRSAADTPAFVEKYASRMNQSPKDWAAGFPVPIVVDVDRLVAWSKPATGARYRVATRAP
jgi:PPOX class probable F420-dependent enzyme